MRFSTRRWLVRGHQLFVKAPPLYPFLFASYPVLALYSLNVDQLRLLVLKKFLIEACLAVAIVWLIAALITRNNRKGAVLTAAFTLLFFTYGYVVNLISPLFGNTTLTSYILLAPTVFLFSWLIIRLLRSETPHQLTMTLNVVGALMVLFPVVSITTYYVTHRQNQAKPPASNSTTVTGKDASNDKPDIYFIVMDAYARQDVVKNLFNYDNGWFIKGLRDRGFQVSNESRCNYSVTFLSLAATLNFTYLDDVIEEYRRTEVDRNTPTEMIRNNRVQLFLKEHGYKIVHFSSGWAVTLDNPLADINEGSHSFEEYRTILLRSSLWGVFFPNKLNEGWRALIFDNLAGLRRIPSVPGPKFVFAHFVCPHEPFVFYPDGSDPRGDFSQETYRQRWSKKRRYLDNLIFMSRRILPVIDDILKKSKREPILILQSDHGPLTFDLAKVASNAQAHERTGNLIAIHMPGTHPPKVADDFTPVNTFRLIFDHYFGTAYGLLPNRTYFCDPANPYRLSDVSSCCAATTNPFVGLNPDTSMANADQDRSDTLTLK